MFAYTKEFVRFGRGELNDGGMSDNGCGGGVGGGEEGIPVGCGIGRDGSCTGLDVSPGGG